MLFHVIVKEKKQKNSRFINTAEPTIAANHDELISTLLAKLKRPTYVGTVNRYLNNYKFDLDDLKIEEHLASEYESASKKATYVEQKCGIEKFFLWYIDD